MSNPAPITLQQLFRYKRPWGELPHQDAAIAELEQDIQTAGYAVAMRRDRPWFKTWSPDGKQEDSLWLDAALKVIKDFEGCKLTAYPDPGTGGAPWTIGWGNTWMDGAPVQKGQTITQAKADQMLMSEVVRVGKVLGETVPRWQQMKPNQQAALVSFGYNCGARFYGTQGFKTISAALAGERYGDVPAAMLLYVNPGTAVEAGLRRRRQAEGSLWAGVTLQQPAMKVPPYLMLTRTSQVDARGLTVLRLQRFKDGVPMDALEVVSGAPGRQLFERGSTSKAGGSTPLPEGQWRVGDIEWASGRDNYEATWGPGLGPIWVPLQYVAPGSTARSAIGIHYDANQGGNPGTAGCVGLKSVEDCRKLVALLRADDPRLLFVDWGLGTCPAPTSTAPQTVATVLVREA